MNEGANILKLVKMKMIRNYCVCVCVSVCDCEGALKLAPKSINMESIWITFRLLLRLPLFQFAPITSSSFPKKTSGATFLMKMHRNSVRVIDGVK